MIHSEQRGRVRHIRLAAPSRRNVFDHAAAAAFLAQLESAHADAATGAVLVAAEGPVFCGGLDFSAPPEDAFFAFGRVAAKPVIAAIQGVATSAGVALLANCHVVLAAQGSSFGLTDLREGRCHQEVLRAVSEALGPRRTRELALTGRIFTTPEALQWGLVHAVTPAFELEDRVLAVAQGLAGAHPEAVRAVFAALE